MTRSVMGALPQSRSGTNDHSYGTGSSYADAPRVTAYVDGVRVWGTAP